MSEYGTNNCIKCGKLNTNDTSIHIHGELIGYLDEECSNCENFDKPELWDRVGRRDLHTYYIPSLRTKHLPKSKQELIERTTWKCKKFKSYNPELRFRYSCFVQDRCHCNEDRASCAQEVRH